MSRTLVFTFAVCLSLFLLPSDQLRGESIDFSSGFVDGQLVNTMSSGTTDVTFAFTDAGTILTSGQPEISSGSGLDDSLAFRMNSSNRTDFVSLLVTFDDMDVENVMFTLGDIDKTDRAWQDIVVVTAFLDGVEVGVSVSNLGSTVGEDFSNIYKTANNATLYGFVCRRH